MERKMLGMWVESRPEKSGIATSRAVITTSIFLMFTALIVASCPDWAARETNSLSKIFSLMLNMTSGSKPT